MNPYATSTQNETPPRDPNKTPLVYLYSDEDEPMADATADTSTANAADTSTAIVGGIGAVQNDTYKFVQCVAKAVEEFHKNVVANDESRRIKKATMPRTLASVSERIAATIAAERPVTTPVLRGVVRTEAEKTNAALMRQVQSLQAKMDSMESKSKGKAKKDKARKDFQSRSGRAAGRGPSNNQGRGKAPGRGNAGTASSLESNEPRSKNKQPGNGRASKNKKRS